MTRSGAELSKTRFRPSAILGPQRVVWDLQRGTEDQEFLFSATDFTRGNYFPDSSPKTPNHTRREGGDLHKNL